MKKSSVPAEGAVERVKGVGAIILGVSESRNWIELLYEGDLMHTKNIDLPADTLFDIFIEEIPHKSTVYEHPRMMIFLASPCDVEICREGNKVILRGCAPD